MLVVDVVVVTSSTGMPLGTVSATVVVGAGFVLGDHLHRHVVPRVGDEHHDAGLGDTW